MRARFVVFAFSVCFFRVQIGSAQAVPESTAVILLGTGTPRPDPKAQGPATAITVGKTVFLFDAGSGVERQLNAANLPINGVTAVFFTHLHSDHTLGYPDLILTSWVMGRRTPLQAFGPSGLAAMTMNLYAAYEEDIKNRTEGLEREAPGGHLVDVHEIRPGIVYSAGGVRVTAFAVPHGNWKESFGFRIDTPDRSIVISGDTRPSEELVKQAAGVDVLIHEVYPSERVKPENRPGGEHWPQYMKEFHTSDKELGEIASRAKPRLLILHHVVRMGGTDEEMLQAIRKAGYTGRVVVGKDLERY